MKPVFIYRPKSGDRVFAENPTNCVLVVKWPNGCRHVLGGVHLEWCTVTNKYWRDEAREACGQIVEQVGGVAWDEQGRVNIIIPWEHAQSTMEIMDLLSGGAREKQPDLFRKGIATLILSAPGCWEFKMQGWITSPEIPRSEAEGIRYKDWTGEIVGGMNEPPEGE